MSRQSAKPDPRQHLRVTGILGLILAFLYLLEGSRYPQGSMAQPGPGLYPLLLGSLLLFSASGLVLEAMFGSSEPSVAWPSGSARRRFLAVLGATLGYILLLPYLGHALAAALLTLAVLHSMGSSPWPLKIMLSFVLSLASYYLFVLLLGIPLPPGVWSH